MGSVWKITRSVARTPAETADEILAEPMRHSLAVHGDDGVYPDCKECRRLMRQLMAKFSLTPQMYLKAKELGMVPPDSGTLHATAKALVEEDADE